MPSRWQIYKVYLSTGALKIMENISFIVIKQGGGRGLCSFGSIHLGSKGRMGQLKSSSYWLWPLIYVADEANLIRSLVQLYSNMLELESVQGRQSIVALHGVVNGFRPIALIWYMIHKGGL